MINGGFYEFDGQRFHLLLERTAVGNDNVVAILPYGNSEMVCLLSTVDCLCMNMVLFLHFVRI